MWPQTSWKLKWKFKTNGLSRFLPYETQCCRVISICNWRLCSENAKFESYGYCDNLATLMFHNKDAVYSIWGQKNKCYPNLFHFHNSTVTNSNLYFLQSFTQKKGRNRISIGKIIFDVKVIYHKVEVDLICDLIFLSKIDNVVKNSTKCQKKIHLKEKWILTVILAQIRTKVWRGHGWHSSISSSESRHSLCIYLVPHFPDLSLAFLWQSFYFYPLIFGQWRTFQEELWWAKIIIYKMKVSKIVLIV